MSDDDESIACGTGVPLSELTDGDAAEVERFTEFLRLAETEEGRQTLLADPIWRAYMNLPATPDVAGDGEHFHGCPTPTGRPFDCDYCQERCRSMAGD